MSEVAVNRPGGLLAGLASYSIWGLFPLYFVLLDELDPTEVLSHRVLWATAVLTIVVAAFQQWQQIHEAFRKRSSRIGLSASAFFVGVMWFFYGYGVLTDRALDVALGYFICPLVTTFLAVLVQKERLNALQWTATSIGACAIAAVTMGYGRFPWISCVIALSFGLYGLSKSRAGSDVKATVGLFIETVLLLPVICGALGWLYATDRASFIVGGLKSTDFWLILSGPVTLLPLFLFAVAAARLPLFVLGTLQYLNPVLQVIVGITILQEEMPLGRLIGFGLVWLALLVLLVESFYRRLKRLGPRHSLSVPKKSNELADNAGYSRSVI